MTISYFSQSCKGVIGGGGCRWRRAQAAPLIRQHITLEQLLHLATLGVVAGVAQVFGGGYFGVAADIVGAGVGAGVASNAAAVVGGAAVGAGNSAPPAPAPAAAVDAADAAANAVHASAGRNPDLPDVVAAAEAAAAAAVA